MGKFIADLFKSVGNKAWDLARILAGLAFFSIIALAGYRTYSGQEVALKDLSGALMEVLIGSGLIIGAKDVAAAHANKSQ
jgi:hypothetical protein